MAKRTTKTEVVTKALARSGPELTPSQIRLDDSVQTDNNKVFTQSDLNQGIGDGGAAPDLDGYAKTDYVDSADNALNALIAANTQAIADLDIPEAGSSALSLPGYKWELCQFTNTSNPPSQGEMKFNPDTNTFYINVNTKSVDKPSIQLARQTHKFSSYEVNGTMLLSIFSEEDGLVYFGKILALQLKYYNGETYFELTETNHAVSDLKVGTTYNVTVSGLF